jgi:signal transduction histidine kinase/ActR/RegA family two-component response regulator
MNTATALSLIACAVETLMGVMALAFAGAPGWRYFKIFALVAFTAAAYSLGDTWFTSSPGSVALIPWVARANISVGYLHCAAWIAYARVQYGYALRRRERAAIAGLGLLALLALIPSVFLTDEVVAQNVSWAGVTYHVPRPTELGNALVLAFPLSLLLPVVGYVQKARQRAPGARTHLIGFGVFYLTVINEVLVSLGLFENLYLVDVGFMAAVLAAVADMTYRVTGDARRLKVLSSELSREVEERTRELTETRATLVRAERLSALGQLSASIGHEINNPLSYVIGNLEFVSKELQDLEPSQAVTEALRDASSGAERIRRIVHELRAFVRGSDRDRRELVELGDVLGGAIKLVWGELRHRARLERDIRPLPRLVADPIRLTQVFVNVLMNAVQAIPEERNGQLDSVITVRTRVLDDNSVSVEIVDSGVGIPEENQPRLFEPFFSTKPFDKGTGLGLFVSHGIVSALGGRIDVESQVGKGTLVRIVLPVGQESSLPIARPSSIPPPSVKGRRLLVIDDDVLVARTLARMLKQHEVEVATSGRDALKRLAENGTNYDLVLCDLMMPDVTGMDVYEEVERLYPSLASKFVFISGGGITERSRKFLELHAECVLSKPIDGKKLDRILARRSAEGLPVAPPAPKPPTLDIA